MTIRTFHICVMANPSSGFHFFDGIVESARAPSAADGAFYHELKARVAGNMSPVRHPDEIVILSLSLLDTRDE